MPEPIGEDVANVLVGQPVVHDPASLATGDDAAVAQHAKLVANPGLAEANQERQVADAQLICEGQGVEQTRARWVGEGRECGGQGGGSRAVEDPPDQRGHLFRMDALGGATIDGQCKYICTTAHTLQYRSWPRDAQGPFTAVPRGRSPQCRWHRGLGRVVGAATGQADDERRTGSRALTVTSSGTPSDTSALRVRVGTPPGWTRLPLGHPTASGVTIHEMRLRLPFTVLALAVLLVSHQLVYVATYGWRGIERALAAVGHDAYWFVIGSAVGLAVVAGLALSLRRWLSLRSELRRNGGAQRQRTTIEWAPVRRTVLHLVPRLALVALALFFAQENLEHYLLHGGHMPGLSVWLGPDYVATVPIFLAVSGLVALITAVLRLGLEALERLVEQTTRRRGVSDAPWPSGRHLPGRPRSRGTSGLGRAPPTPA